MKMFRKDEGFTLVELMVVVLIIGILVAIAIPIFNAAKATAQQKTCFANERTVEGAFQSWQASGGDPATVTNQATMLTALVPNYVKVAPACPNAGTYTSAVVGSALTMTCSDHGHF